MYKYPVDKWIRQGKLWVINSQLWITKPDSNSFFQKKMMEIHNLWITFGTPCSSVDNLV